MIRVRVEKISFDVASQMGVVLLLEEEQQRILPIWVGISEARAIHMGLQGLSSPRPLTHDLVLNIIKNFGYNVDYSIVTKLDQGTYYANIVISSAAEKKELDSRPSDAIAIAIRASAPIYISDEIFEKTQKKEEFEEHVKSEIYKQYLSSLNEDDLKKA